MQLGDRICAGDFEFWEGYHPCVKFSRTKTLLAGDDCCDHTLTWTEETPREHPLDPSAGIPDSSLPV